MNPIFAHASPMLHVHPDSIQIIIVGLIIGVLVAVNLWMVRKNK